MAAALVFMQIPCGHLDISITIVKFPNTGTFAARYDARCWHCRRPVKSISPVTTEAEIIKIMMHRPKLERLAFSYRIAYAATVVEGM